MPAPERDGENAREDPCRDEAEPDVGGNPESAPALAALVVDRALHRLERQVADGRVPPVVDAHGRTVADEALLATRRQVDRAAERDEAGLLEALGERRMRRHPVGDRLDRGLRVERDDGRSRSDPSRAGRRSRRRGARRRSSRGSSSPSPRSLRSSRRAHSRPRGTDRPRWPRRRTARSPAPR